MSPIADSSANLWAVSVLATACLVPHGLGRVREEKYVVIS
ncbi:hypothetical protein JOE25_003992 [Serratia sp. PL17]|nr:hypothetical protein [Serratia sp. PL17]